MISKENLERIADARFVNVSVREKGGVAVNVGRTGLINVLGNGDVVLMAENKEILRKSSRKLALYFHQGYGGVDLVLREGRRETTYTAHFVLHVDPHAKRK